MRLLLIFLSIFLYGDIQKIHITPPKEIIIPPISDEKLKDFSFSGKIVIKPFYISKYEITVSDYEKYLNKTLSQRNKKRPLTNVDFYTAQKVCNFYGGRLPTQKEWIVAAGVKVAKSKCYEFLKYNQFYPYPTAKYPLDEKDKQSQCMLEDDDEIEIDRIGSEFIRVDWSYENINGTFGMLGNVSEWVDDEVIYFGKKYKIIKGGNYDNFGFNHLFDVRVVDFLPPSSKRKNVGFRCVWEDKK